MQLGKPETLGVLDHHQAGVGDVDAHLDHRGRHQHLRVAAAKTLHLRFALVAIHASVHIGDRKSAERAFSQIAAVRGDVLQALFGFFHRGHHHVGLLARVDALAQVGVHLGSLGHLHHARDGGLAPGRLATQRAQVQISVQRDGQRARNGRGRHHQRVWHQRHLALALLAHGRALLHAEAVLLVDHGNGQTAECHAAFEQRMRSNNQIHAAARQPGHDGVALRVA